MSIDRNRIVVAAVATLALAMATFAVVPASQAAVGDDVRLNEIQVIGSHNSYKVLPSQAEQDLIRSFILDGADLMQYQHAPLGAQFGNQKVRQIELDVWVDSAGGRFTLPLLRSVLDLGPYQPELMNQPGTKTFHIQDVDYGSTCPTFVVCLQHVKAWSDANAGHVPISILVELKDTPLVLPPLEFTGPEPWTAAAMDVLDAEIRSVFGEDHMITPDDIRGGAATLRDAVTTTGWPTLGESRGKVMFVMDNDGHHRTSYLSGHPSLSGRVLFTNATPGADDAAFIKMNDPRNASIPSLVEQGFLVRTRADGDTVEARTEDTSKRDTALASGAQWVSTDYPVPGMAVGFTSSYVAEIPGGTVARCNPVNAPASCVDSSLDLVGQAPPQQPPVTRPPVSTPGSTVPSTGSTVPGTATTLPTTGSTVPTTGTTVPGTPTTRPGNASGPGQRPSTNPSALPAEAAAPVRGNARYTG